LPQRILAEAESSGKKWKPQPVSWGPRWAEKCFGVSRQIRRDQIEPDCKHTLLQWASVAQVTKVPGDVTPTADLLGSFEVQAVNMYARSR